MTKLQYLADDLARILGVGKIQDMFVVQENGIQILRMECTASPGNEYKTVTTKGAKKPAGKSTRREPAEPRQRNPEGLGAMLMNKFKDKEKPQFMKDAGF